MGHTRVLNSNFAYGPRSRKIGAASKSTVSNCARREIRISVRSNDIVPFCSGVQRDNLATSSSCTHSRALLISIVIIIISSRYFAATRRRTDLSQWFSDFSAPRPEIVRRNSTATRAGTRWTRFRRSEELGKSTPPPSFVFKM